MKKEGPSLNITIPNEAMRQAKTADRNEIFQAHFVWCLSPWYESISIIPQKKREDTFEC